MAKNDCKVLMNDMSILPTCKDNYASSIRLVMHTLQLYNFKLKDRTCTFESLITKYVRSKVIGMEICILEWNTESIASGPVVS
jgi:hypothetical protein